MIRILTARLFPVALALALAGCGAEPAAPPTPVPSAVARQYLHLVTRLRSPDAADSSTFVNRLATYAIDPRTGAPSLAGAPVDFGQPPAPGYVPDVAVTADPSGRVLYVYHPIAGTLRSYLVDAASGRLTLDGEAKVGTVTKLAASPSRLYVASVYSWHHYYLQAFRAEPGVLTETTPSAHDGSGYGGYVGLVGADPAHDVFYFIRDAWRYVVAATPDAAAPTGYRELAVLDARGGADRPSFDLEGYSMAAGGFVFLEDEHKALHSYVANESNGQLEHRGVAPAVSTQKLVFGAGLLAGARERWVSSSLSYYGVDLCRVSGSGELTPGRGLAIGSFEAISGMAFHPTGRFLYVSGKLADTVEATWAPLAHQPTLTTLLVEPDGGLSLYAVQPVAPELGFMSRQLVLTTAP